MTNILGIDGGGSGSRFYFQSSNGNDLFCEGPPLQLSLSNADTLGNAILNTIESNFKNLDFNLIIAGIAGAGNLKKAIPVQQKLSKILKTEVVVMSDAELTWNVLNENETDLLVIHGTGSAAVFYENRYLNLIGGSGPKSGDILSARSFSEFNDGDSQSPESILQNSIEFLEKAKNGNMPYIEIFKSQLDIWVHLLNERLHKSINLHLHGGLFQNKWFKTQLIDAIKKNHPNLSILHNNANIAKLAAHKFQHQNFARFKFQNAK